MKEHVPCKVCGAQTLMTETEVCDRCWEMTRHSKGFIVLNIHSQGFCAFNNLNAALEFYTNGIARGEQSYLLLSIIKGKFSVEKG